MDFERSCIAKILVEDQLVEALAARLTPVLFDKAENKRAYSWILDFWGNYGSAPTVEAFKVHFPTFRLPRTDEPIEYIVDQLREQRRGILLQDALVDVTEMMHGDDDVKSPDVVKRLSQFLIEVNAETSEAEDTDLVSTWLPRLNVYKALRKGGGQKGITVGVPSLDASFGGLRPERLITLIGEPKAGKSMLLMAMAHAAHLAGATPMFVGFEMSNQEQAERHDALVAGLDHSKISMGQLTLAEVRQLRRALRARENMHPFLLSSDVSSATTVSGLRAKIEQYHPSVLYVDGVYLMDDELGADRYVEQSTHLTNITRSLKRLAQTTKIPIVCTTQVLTWKVSKRQGLTADSIGYSSSFAQDSDIIIGVEKVENDDQLRKLKVILSRTSAPMETNISWDWSTSNFTELGQGGGVKIDDDERWKGGGRAEGRI